MPATKRKTRPGETKLKQYRANLRMSTELLRALVRGKGWRIPIEGLYQHCWIVIAPLGAAYRRTLLRKTRVVAVVGSFGKTTTARAVRHVLGIRETFACNRNSWSFLPTHLLISKPSTRLLALEVGIDGPGQMTRYAKVLRPDIAVVTAVGSEHGRTLRSLENTRAEKAAMVAALPPSGLAVLNGDDPNVLWMKERTSARTLTVGLGEGNDLRAAEVRGGRLDGTEFVLDYRGVRTPMSTRLIGSHQLIAVLSAVAVGLEEGLALETVSQRIGAFEPTPGRLQVVRLDNGATLLRDDYKSSYETVVSALATLASLPAKRKVVVIGDVSEPPGSQGVVYRDIGARIAGVADICLVASNATASQRYQAGARHAGRLACAFRCCGRDPLDNTDALREILLPGDLVLIKGRDTQRLERIALGLQGRKISCGRAYCHVHALSCDECPLL